MLFLNNFGRKSISLSWFVSYIVIIAAATVLNIYTYEHAIIGTREEKPVISGVSELVPFSF